MKHARLPTLPVERATGLVGTYDDDVYTANATALQVEPDDTQSLLARRQGTVSEGICATVSCLCTSRTCQPCHNTCSCCTDAADIRITPRSLKWQRYYATAMFCLVGQLLSADQNLLAPNLTAVADDFGFDANERDKYLGGVISAAFFLLGAPAALIVGYLSDITKRTHLLFWVVILGKHAYKWHLPAHG